MHTRSLTGLVRVGVTVVLGGIGAAAGFTHTHDWAVANGQTGWLAWADAVVIEGLAVVAGFEVRRDHHAGSSARLPLVVLVVAFGVQMTAQVAQAPPTPAGWLLAAMPALGFLTVVKLTLRHAHAAQDTPSSAQPTPGVDAPAATPSTSPPADSSTGSTSTGSVGSGSVLGKLPASLRVTVTELATATHGRGQQVTAEQIGDRVALPERMLTELAAELNATVNHHRMPA